MPSTASTSLPDRTVALQDLLPDLVTDREEDSVARVPEASDAR